MRTIAVVGGSLAGISAARALRAQGFDGRVLVYADETGPAYDRPPLSKAFLAGAVGEDDLALMGADEQLDLDWRAGVRAERLLPSSRLLELSDGSEQPVDGLVLATGARPRRPWPRTPAGVHVLRTLADARGLRADLVPGARLVVVGAGFIGAEVASTARALGLDVTIVEAAPSPLSGVLGVEMGELVAGLHAAHGVPLIVGTAVTGFYGIDRVSGVQLADGRVLPADAVLLGVGVTPNVEWLAGTGLMTAGGIPCDEFGATAVPGVVAVGDCAAWYDPQLGVHHRLEHWSAARERSSVAVATLLSGGRARVRTRPAYFWSDQYGLRLQVAGRTFGADSVEVDEGSVEQRDFVAVYRRRGEPVAALAFGRPKEFMRWRKQLAQAAVERATESAATSASADSTAMVAR